MLVYIIVIKIVQFIMYFFVELQRQGYFKGINLTLTYEEILERAVVVDDK